MMKIVVFALVFLNLTNWSSLAKGNDARGAVYEMNGLVLTITERSFKLIDRVNEGVHASKILKGEIPIMSIKEAVEKIQASHNLFQEKSVTLSPASNLFIEFEGRVSNLVMSHICRGEKGNYLALSVPDIYFSENLSIKINGQEKIIKQLLISTDPSVGLLLQTRLLWSLLSDYWWFLQKQMDYDRKFKVQGLINYAEQRSDKNEIEKLELTIIIIKINSLP